MKTRVIPLLVACGFLLLPALGQSRIIETWDYERLFKESEVVVIAVAEKTELVGDKPPKHDWPLEFVGQNTTFKVKHTCKGKMQGQSIKILHFKFGDKAVNGGGPNLRPIQIVDGPLFVDFSTTRPVEYLLFLKKLKDGRYEPVSGPIDPALAVRKLGSAD